MTTDLRPAVGIMQPYVFPYLGYFQLVHAVDHFVFYDDVQYTRSGWINRNRIKTNGKPLLFSMPVTGCKNLPMIKDVTCIASSEWQAKFLRTLWHSYSRAPFYKPVSQLVQTVLSGANGQPISNLAVCSVTEVMNYLGLGAATHFHLSSEVFPKDGTLRQAGRFIDIMRRLDAHNYVNLPGGIGLYKFETFAVEGVNLMFIMNQSADYNQAGAPFLPNLSILDVLMHNSPEQTRSMLDQYTLLSDTGIRAAFPAKAET
jgi:hypothetical protein